MRIISPFHDYYDVAQKQGQDRTLIYHRVPKDDYESKLPFVWLARPYRFISKIEWHDCVVGFCGKIYPVVEVAKPSFDFRRGQKKHKYCFKLEDIDNFVTENYDDDDVEEYLSKDTGWKIKKKGWSSDQKRSYFEEHFRKFEELARDNFAKYRSYMENNKCPVFIATDNRRAETRIAQNCILKHVEFFRLFPPFQAFQEISMFMANIAQPEKPIPVPDDVTMAEIKGFDKWSFRKPPSKKKRR